MLTSGYFDAALRGQAKKSKTMKFEFPQRDPNEWEWILSLFTPLPSARLSKDNITTALSWFAELRSPVGLEACDSFYTQIIRGYKFRFFAEQRLPEPCLTYALRNVDFRQRMKTELAQLLRALASSVV